MCRGSGRVHCLHGQRECAGRVRVTSVKTALLAEAHPVPATGSWSVGSGVHAYRRDVRSTSADWHRRDGIPDRAPLRVASYHRADLPGPEYTNAVQATMACSTRWPIALGRRPHPVRVTRPWRQPALVIDLDGPARPSLDGTCWPRGGFTVIGVWARPHRGRGRASGDISTVCEPAIGHGTGQAGLPPYRDASLGPMTFSMEE